MQTKLLSIPINAIRSVVISFAILAISLILSGFLFWLPTWNRDESVGGDIWISKQMVLQQGGYWIQALLLPIIVIVIAIVELIVRYIALTRTSFRVKMFFVLGGISSFLGIALIVFWIIFRVPPWMITDPQAGGSDRLSWSIGPGLIGLLFSFLLILVYGIVYIVIGVHVKKKSEAETSYVHLEDAGGLINDGDDKERDVFYMNRLQVLLSIVIIVACVIYIIVYAAPVFKSCPGVDINQFVLPPGFKIEIYASNVKYARQMALSPNGNLYVGALRFNKMGSMQLSLVQDTQKLGKGDKVTVLMDNLRAPSGVTLRNGDLYVMDVNTLMRFPDIDNRVESGTITHEIVTENFPDVTPHGWKYLRNGPDGLLYVPIGSPCNICERKEPFFSIGTVNISENGTIIPYGDSVYEPYCNGVRNSVGFDFHPITKELWFTDNGRDWLGEQLPHEELNRAYAKNLDFGFPYCFDYGVPDPEFNDGHNCSLYETPVALLEPHGAVIGMQFYTGDMFPEEYKNSIFIAEHGSWNSEGWNGYKVSVAFLDPTGTSVTKTVPFLTGFVQNNIPCGRPTDILTMHDGSILVSDDFGHHIYRISYSNPETIF